MVYYVFTCKYLYSHMATEISHQRFQDIPPSVRQRQGSIPPPSYTYNSDGDLSKYKSCCEPATAGISVLLEGSLTLCGRGDHGGPYKERGSGKALSFKRSSTPQLRKFKHSNLFINKQLPTIVKLT